MNLSELKTDLSHTHALIKHQNSKRYYNQKGNKIMNKQTEQPTEPLPACNHPEVTEGVHQCAACKLWVKLQTYASGAWRVSEAEDKARFELRNADGLG